MPDNRDQSRQKRSKENRAKSASVQARKQAVASKAEPVEEEPTKKRRTRAQAAPVRGSADSKAKSADTSGSNGAAKETAARPAPVEVDPDAPWFRRVVEAPGGKWVFISLALAIAATVFIVVYPTSRAVERDDSWLEGRTIEKCVDTDGNEVELDGRTVQEVCGYRDDLSEAQKDSDNRSLAVVEGQLLDLFGPTILIYMAIPVVASGVAVAIAPRPNRRRTFGYSALLYGLWMLMIAMALRMHIFYLPSFGLLVYGWWQARKADPPIRPERTAPSGGGLFGGGGGGGLFGGGRKRGGDVIDTTATDDDK